jgi:hypothetical protein
MPSRAIRHELAVGPCPRVRTRSRLPWSTSGAHIKPREVRSIDDDVLHRSIVCAVALVGTIACGPTSYVGGRMAWTGPRFGVDYVAPPWELESETEEELRLRIRAEVFGVELDGSPPTHVLVLGVVDGPSSILDLLPEDARPELGETTGFELPDTTGELPDTTGELPDTTGQLPDGWQNVDVGDPTDVALFELDYLLTEQKADLVHELRSFATDSGITAMEYEVVVPPGLFVRAFYLPSRDGTVRAIFASLFDLAEGDTDRMAATLRTDVDAPLVMIEEG